MKWSSTDNIYEMTICVMDLHAFPIINNKKKINHNMISRIGIIAWSSSSLPSLWINPDNCETDETYTFVTVGKGGIEQLKEPMTNPITTRHD